MKRSTMNDARADWAAAALGEFQCCGVDDDNALCDLLCDLMHWGDRNEVEFTAADPERSRHWWDGLPLLPNAGAGCAPKAETAPFSGRD